MHQQTEQPRRHLSDELSGAILAEVAGYYRTGVPDIRGRSRERAIAEARHVAAWMMRNYSSASFAEIGVAVSEQGRPRDHSTVIWAVKVVNRSPHLVTLGQTLWGQVSRELGLGTVTVIDPARKTARHDSLGAD